MGKTVQLQKAAQELLGTGTAVFYIPLYMLNHMTLDEFIKNKILKTPKLYRQFQERKGPEYSISAQPIIMLDGFNELSLDAQSNISTEVMEPLIQGYNPVNFNAMTMDGGQSWKVIDGVRYSIVECDNVEILADHRLYLCVMDEMMYNKAAYDVETGVICPNADYAGMNLLFDLPLDAGKADPQAVEKYLDTFEISFPNADNPEAEDAAEQEGCELLPEYVD